VVTSRARPEPRRPQPRLPSERLSRTCGTHETVAVGPEPARSAKEPTAAAARSPTVRQHAQEQRKRAEYDVGQAKSAANKAITARQETYAQLEAADQTVAETGGRVERVRQELEEALQAQSRAQKDQARAQAAFARADRDAQDAQQRLADSSERIDR
jgi:hypothetical protein